MKEKMYKVTCISRANGKKETAFTFVLARNAREAVQKGKADPFLSLFFNGKIYAKLAR